VFLLLDTKLCPHRVFTSDTLNWRKPLELVCALEKRSCLAVQSQPVQCMGELLRFRVQRGIGCALLPPFCHSETLAFSGAYWIYSEYPNQTAFCLCWETILHSKRFCWKKSGDDSWSTFFLRTVENK